MTRGDITRMAREAGLLPNHEVYEDELERFAAFIADAEREACIERVKTCLYLDWEGRVLPFGPVLDANAEILRCVSAIRARKAVAP